jgi:hypothetical protein
MTFWHMLPLRNHLPKGTSQLAKDDIETRLKALEIRRLELMRKLDESEQVLTETDLKIADFKRRQDLRMADELIQDDHRQPISEAATEMPAP